MSKTWLGIRNVLVLFLLVSVCAEARAVQVWKPDELFQKADFVCVAIPTELTLRETYEQKPTALPALLAVARLKVLSVLKGTPVRSFELRYLVVDYGKIARGMLMPPEDIWVFVGKRHRLYLKQKSGQPYFVSALEGELDDGPSVERLGPNEPNDSKPLPETKIVQIAKDYLRRKAPKIVEERREVFVSYINRVGDYSVPEWMVSFGKSTWDRQNRTSKTVKAQIHITADGHVDQFRTKLRLIE